LSMMTPFTPAISDPAISKATLLRAAYYLFLAGGLLGLGYAAYEIFSAYTYQVSKTSTFERAIPGPAPSSSGNVNVAAAGEVIGEMEIPRLGIKVMVAQGVSPDVLARAVGHTPETPLPGEWGNVAFAGHRDTFFRPLRSIERGDAIIFKTTGGDLQYQVESARVVPPTDLDVLKTSGDRTLTLITCYPFYYIGPAPDRFVVRARQVLPSQ